jgi:hypothetical protein
MYLQRCFVSTLTKRSSGIGNSNNIRSVKTLIQPWAMRNAPMYIHPCGSIATSHALEIGVQEDISVLTCQHIIGEALKILNSHTHYGHRNGECGNEGRHDSDDARLHYPGQASLPTSNAVA